MQVNLPRSVQNWLSVTGIVVAGCSLFTIAVLFVLSFFLGQGQAYLGLVIYILLPAIMTAGLLMIPIGMIRKIWRERGMVRAEVKPWPCLDLNNSRQRKAFAIFSIGTTIFLFISAIGSYEAFHLTESVQFCGLLCHQVMEPQYVAYRNSPHARVDCVACHVGPGASWYVRSKLSGLYQVYATLADIYPRPISTPISNLRPAREVCEQCHWPQKFYAYNLRFESRYLSDEENSRWDIRLIMKIGAEYEAGRLEQGIHWHINRGVKIEYIATDRQRQTIPWVRFTDLRSGAVTVYEDRDSPLEPERLARAEIRTMDCIDCHNEPSHRYLAPSRFIDNGILAGDIPLGLPNIKSAALAAVDVGYSSAAAAREGIKTRMIEYYRREYPQIEAAKQKLIEQAASGVEKQFQRNIFPGMKVSWRAYPNNIGHLEYKGCFRCHDGVHADDQGNRIRNDCDLCHIINAQGESTKLEVAKGLEQSLPFRHPVDIGGEWRESSCNDCHEGLAP